jgi:hypothetical protein
MPSLCRRFFNALETAVLAAGFYRRIGCIFQHSFWASFIGANTVNS